MKEILSKNQNIWLSISATTREPRIGEKEGESYFFLNREKFKKMIDENLFLEWAELLETIWNSLSSVNEKIKGGFNVLLEIEVEGAKQIKEKFPILCQYFYFLRSRRVERRIRNRGTEEEEAIKQRLTRAKYEISESKQFDFALINHNVDETAKRIIKFIQT